MMKHIGGAFAMALLIAASGGAGEAQRLGKGAKLVDFAAQTLDGKKTHLLAFIGGRVAVFKLGATWCGWCTRQIPAMNEAAKAFPGDKVAVFQVDVGEDAKTVEAHNKEHKVAFATLLDPDSTAAGAYGVTAIPDTIVAGHDGTILYRGHYTTADELRRCVQPALRALDEEISKKKAAESKK